MKLPTPQKNKGFTLIETMIAVFILTAALGGFFSLMASSLFSARYARNEITANYLLQEAVDYVRNNRDTVAFQGAILPSGGWVNFLNNYGYGNGSGSNFCFSQNGCYFEPARAVTEPSVEISACNETSTFGTIKCPVFTYDSTASHNDYYTYDTSAGTPSKFKRKVFMSVPSSRPDELDIKVTLEWQNGGLTRSKSLTASLLNWQQ